MSHAAEGAPASLTRPSKKIPVPGKTYFYVLSTYDRSRGKIGRTLDPARRIAELVRLYPDIDLSHSILIQLEMYALEEVLHAVFSRARLELPEKLPGFTEWFAGDLTHRVADLCCLIARCRGQTFRLVRGLEFLLLNAPVDPSPTVTTPAQDVPLPPALRRRSCHQSPPRGARPHSGHTHRNEGGRRGRKR